jgi:hypothetical protein
LLAQKGITRPIKIAWKNGLHSHLLLIESASFFVVKLQYSPDNLTTHQDSYTIETRIDGAFMRNTIGDGITVWSRREFQQLFGLFSNSSTVDRVVEQLGQVCACWRFLRYEN